MKGLVKTEWGDGFLEIRDVPEPTPGPGQVKIRIKYAGICGSDIHTWHGTLAIPHRCPVVIGHEFFGEVAEVGEGVTDFKPGDRVVSESFYSRCGTCKFCRNGETNMCMHPTGIAYTYNGGMTQYTIAPDYGLHHVPDGVSDIAATLCEPAAGMMHALFDLTKIMPEDVVLVSGPGTIGMMALQIARVFGARVVITGMNQDKERLKLAKELGAEAAVNIQEEDLKQIIMDMTDGYGADVVVECSGSPAAMDSGLQLVRKHGRYVQYGLCNRKIEFDVEKICYKELQFTGCMGQTYENWEMLLKLIANGKIKMEPLVSDILPLSRWREGFERVMRQECFKILLTPEG